jgi:hypothetical protein
MDPSAIESVALTSLLRIERRLDAREQVDALVHRGCRLSRLEPWVTQQFRRGRSVGRVDSKTSSDKVLGRVRDALPVLCLQKC